MPTKYVRITTALALLALALGALAWLSYMTTQRRTDGAIAPSVLQITVVDSAGNPVPRPVLRLIDAATLEAADDSVFEIDPRAGAIGDDQGQVALHFGGQPLEIQDWRLFWLFPRIISGPRGLDAYLASISATSHSRWLIALPDLLAERAGTLPGSAEVRYVARVTLP
jgi:hypothetical protein